MKNIISVLSLILISSPALAKNCDKEAVAIAKLNLDSKAKAYGFNSSDIMESSLKKLSEGADTISYSISGEIYKGEYEITLSLDNSCSIKSLNIKDVSAK